MSLATILTVLYMAVLRRQDRISVKPHASPIFHALQLLLGNQTQENLKRFRSLGGIQSYPSRTKDNVDVDFSTGYGTRQLFFRITTTETTTILREENYETGTN